jgi:predicted nucleic acid-binding protein
VIVIDSSALVEILAEKERAGALRTLAVGDVEWLVPEHIVLEVVSALRGLWLGGHLERSTFEAAVSRVGALPLDVWPSKPLLPRIVELAANATPYDAAYVALAERLDAPLLTADHELSRMPGIRCRLLPATGRRGA